MLDAWQAAEKMSNLKMYHMFMQAGVWFLLVSK